MTPRERYREAIRAKARARADQSRARHMRGAALRLYRTATEERDRQLALEKRDEADQAIADLEARIAELEVEQTAALWDLRGLEIDA